MKKFDLQDNIFVLSALTRGNQPKWYKDNYYIKADAMGYESVAELISYVFSSCTNIKSVAYDLCVINGNTCGCYSKNILKSGESLITLDRLIKQCDKDILKYYGSYDFIDRVIILCSNVLNIDKRKLILYFSYMCKFDAIILNEDRHLNNVAFIKSGDKYRLCPLFDNGMSLLSNQIWYNMTDNVDKLMLKVRSATFSSNFDEQCRYFNDLPKIKVDLNKLVAKLGVLNAPFKYAEFQRAITVLFKRLQQTKGVYWVEV